MMSHQRQSPSSALFCSSDLFCYSSSCGTWQNPRWWCLRTVRCRHHLWRRIWWSSRRIRWRRVRWFRRRRRRRFQWRRSEWELVMVQWCTDNAHLIAEAIDTAETTSGHQIVVRVGNRSPPQSRSRQDCCSTHTSISGVLCRPKAPCV